MKILITTLITVVTIFAGFWGGYNYVPIYHIKDITSKDTFGAITTIQGTDTLSASRTTINNNFTDLDSGKMDKATTTLYELTTANSITSATALASIGTITSGVWNGTKIGVAYGGTGTTSPERYRVLFGDGDNGFTMASTSGTSGQFLTSNGNGNYPSWTTSSINEAGTYNWSGTHTFATGIANFVNNVLFGDGTATTTLKISPYSNTASSTVLSHDGSGNWYHTPLTRLVLAEATSTVATGATTTLFAITIPANQLVIDSAIKGSAQIQFNNLGGGDDAMYLALNYGGVSVAHIGANDVTGANCFSGCNGVLDFYMIYDGTNQTGGFTYNGAKNNGTTFLVTNFMTFGAVSETRSVGVSSDQLFSLDANDGGGVDGDITIKSVYVELIK